jgi:hypothetical protein
VKSREKRKGKAEREGQTYRHKHRHTEKCRNIDRDRYIRYAVVDIISVVALHTF